MIQEKDDYATDEELQQRLRSGAVYFKKEIEPVLDLFEKTNMPLDNKELRKQLNERLQALEDALWIKLPLLEYLFEKPFTVTGYLKQKAIVMLDIEGDSSSSGSSYSSSFRAAKAPKEKRERKERIRNNAGKVKVDVPTDILHPELYRSLTEWRTAKTREVNLPAYIIMQQKALMGIVNLLPDTPQALEAVPYFGAKGVEKYGLEILGIVRNYMKEHQLKRPEIKFVTVDNETKTNEQGTTGSVMAVKSTEVTRGEKGEGRAAKKDKEKDEMKDTKEISYEMFCQGLSLEEIAQIRELVPGTIANHLEYYVRLGKIKVEEIVAEDHIQKIRHYLEAHGFNGLVAIKAAMGDDVSYSDIKFVLAVTSSD